MRTFTLIAGGIIAAMASANAYFSWRKMPRSRHPTEIEFANRAAAVHALFLALALWGWWLTYFYFTR